MKVNWHFIVDTFGDTYVAVSVDNIIASSLDFKLPKTYESLGITPNAYYTIVPENSASWDRLRIHNINVTSLTFNFNWPDGAFQYKGWFYFAGQENFELSITPAFGNITIELPRNTWEILIDEPDFTQPNNYTLVFAYSDTRQIPHFRYRLTEQSSVDVLQLETSEHVNLRYHPVMAGKPWINKTVEVIEQTWSWLKTTLNGTLNPVNLAFVPYGYNRLGTTFGGFTYYGSRNIEIVATSQFGMGFDDEDTALLFHELTHAFTPLLEDLPSFYSEAIAQDTSYDALKRTDLNSSAESLEERSFEIAYEGVGFLHYIWIWKWNDTIYNNPVILPAAYGITAFLGDYMTHLGGYQAYNRLDQIFNKTAIMALDEPKTGKVY